MLFLKELFSLLGHLFVTHSLALSLPLQDRPHAVPPGWPPTPQRSRVKCPDWDLNVGFCPVAAMWLVGTLPSLNLGPHLLNGEAG